MRYWPGLTLILLAGCGPSLPKTYPVAGKVVDQHGKPWPGGMITLHAVADSKVIAVGEIGKDGSFTLTTKMYGKEKPGAAEGEHSVSIDTGPVAGADGQLVIQPVVVPGKYKVEPRENTITITARKAGG